MILNPRDYPLLRDLALTVGALEPLTSFSDAAMAAREAEDRPRDDILVQDSADIAELLSL